MIATPNPNPGIEAMDLFNRSEGTGRPVLLLHGLLGSGSNLGSLARHLQADYRTLSPDLRNHGRSGHSRVMSYPAMVADVLHLLDREGVEECAVIGHSMGGKVAMALAAREPHRVASLLVVDIAPVGYPADRHDAVLRSLQQMPLAHIANRGEAEAWLQPAAPEPGFRQFLLSNLSWRRDRFAWRVNLEVLLHQQAALAAEPPSGEPFQGPVLFIKGQLSDYITTGCSEAIARRFPAAELKIISGAGHWPHAEKPAVFNAQVSRFLQRTYPISDAVQDEN